MWRKIINVEFHMSNWGNSNCFELFVPKVKGLENWFYYCSLVSYFVDHGYCWWLSHCESLCCLGTIFVTVVLLMLWCLVIQLWRGMNVTMMRENHFFGFVAVDCSAKYACRRSFAPHLRWSARNMPKPDTPNLIYLHVSPI